MPSRCEHDITHILLANISEFGLVEKISADDPPSTDSSLEAVALSALAQSGPAGPISRSPFIGVDRK